MASLAAAFSYTAPRFTEEELERERASISGSLASSLEMEKKGLAPIPRESPEMKEREISRLEEALVDISDKEDYVMALEKCPELVATESDPIGFLRSEDFDARAAALRLTKYWKLRCTHFGDRAFLPLTQTGDGALTEEDVGHLRTSKAMQLLPADPQGRAVLLVHQSRLNHTVAHRQLVLRNFFYILFLAYRDPNAQRHGLVFVTDVSGCEPANFDRKLLRHLFELVNEACPFKLRVMHVCFPTYRCVWRLVFPVVLGLMGREMRMKVCVHTGLFKQLLCDLSKFGMKAEGLPPIFGGTCDPEDFQMFLDTCRATEKRENGSAPRSHV